MNNIITKTTLTLVILSLCTSSVNIDAGTEYNFTDFYDFLAQFQTATPENKLIILDEYILWQQNNGGFPILINDTHVIFFYYAPYPVSECAVAGDFNGWNPEVGGEMIKSDLDISFFYKEMSFETTARLDYKIVKNGNEWITDPRNPNKVPGGFGENSELAMPQFVQPTEIQYRPNIPHGQVITLPEPWTDPKVQVYLPPNYNTSKNYSTFYTSDGSEYISYASTVTILDNLIYDGRIEPIIGIFIDPRGDRIVWYECNEAYLSFLDSLVVFIDANYSTIKDPEHRLHLGDSMGGLVSAYVGLERNTIFKLIGSHSGAFWKGETYGILSKYELAPTDLNLKMWFSAGTYEASIYTDTEIMVNYSQSKGWDTEVIFLYEGHSWGSWRHTLDDMLEFFFSPPDIDGTTSEDTDRTSNGEQKINGASLVSLGGFSLLGIANIFLKMKKNHNNSS